MSKKELKAALGAAKEAVAAKDWEAALASASRAVELDPSCYPALCMKGAAAKNLKDSTEAFKSLKKAAKINPDLPVAWKGLIDVCDGTGPKPKDFGIFLEALQAMRRITGSKGNVTKSEEFKKRAVHTLTKMGRHAEAIALLREGENDLEDGSVLLFSMLLQAVAIKMVELESPARVDTDSVDPMEQARQDWAAEDDHDVPAQEGTLDALCSRLFSAFENMSDSDKAVAMAAAASDASGGATANTNEGGGVADGTETNGAVFSGAVCAYVKHIRDSLPDPKEGVEAHWGAWMKLTERCRQLYEQCTGVVTPLPVDCLSVCLEASLGGDLDKKLVSKMADEVLEVDPENGVALVSRGCVLSCLRPPDFAVATGTNMAERQIERSRAADCLKRGLTTFSACSLGWMVLGKLRQEEGVFAEAVDAFSRAAQAAVKDNGVGKDLSQIKFQANVSKIEALAKMKKIMQAWEGVKKLELEAPNTNDSVRIKRIVGVKGALLAAEGRWKEVAEMLKSGSEGLGNHLYPWSLLKLGRTEEAMTIFETKLSRAQDDGSVCSDGELWASLGFVYTQVGGEFITNKKFAFKHLLQGAKLNPGLALAFRGLGAYYLNQDLQDRAVQCMQKALKLDPNDADAGQALSAVYVKSEQWTLATALWESCVDIDKGAIWAWKNLARMHLSKQHFRATNLVVLDIDNVEDGGLPQSADAVHGIFRTLRTPVVVFNRLFV